MLDSAAGTETSLATLEGASFFFAHAAPDSGILARSNGPSKALIGDRGSDCTPVLQRQSGQGRDRSFLQGRKVRGLRRGRVLRVANPWSMLLTEVTKW